MYRTVAALVNNVLIKKHSATVACQAIHVNKLTTMTTMTTYHREGKEEEPDQRHVAGSEHLANFHQDGAERHRDLQAAGCQQQLFYLWLSNSNSMHLLTSKKVKAWMYQAVQCAQLRNPIIRMLSLSRRSFSCTTFCRRNERTDHITRPVDNTLPGQLSQL